MSYTEPQIGTLTLTGDPARFVATERVPVSGLSMDFEPVQDLHGYDYPWPGGGGKNLASNMADDYSRPADYWIFPLSLEQGATYTIWCEFVSDTVTGRSLGIAKSGDRYSNFDSLNLRLNIAGVLYPPMSFTVDETYTAPVLAIYAGATSETLADFISKVHFQVEKGTTKTAWSPYENICPITGRDSVNVYVSPVPAVVDGTDDYEIEFGQTVYAGTLTINEDGSGQIGITKISLIYNGSENWGFSTQPSGDRNRVIASLQTAKPNSAIMGSYVGPTEIVGYSAPEIWKGTINVNKYILIGIPLSITSAEEWKAYLSQHPLQIVYELENPVTIQLDPIEITTLIGLNYVWTSDNNLITISFPYNKEVQPMALTYDHCWTYPKAYIDKLEARIAALETAAADAAEANTAAAPAETRETVAEEITVTEEPETEPVTKKGGK